VSGAVCIVFLCRITFIHEDFGKKTYILPSWLLRRAQFVLNCRDDKE